MKNIENDNGISQVKGYNPLADSSTEPSALIFNNLTWLTTAETALYLRKSQNAIRQMVCRGQLRARKFHRRLYFNKVELDQTLNISFY